MPNKFSGVEKIAKCKKLAFRNVLSSVFFCENKLSQMGKYIHPKRVFGKLSNSLAFCVTFDDLLFKDISLFMAGSGGTGIEN